MNVDRYRKVRRMEQDGGASEGERLNARRLRQRMEAENPGIRQAAAQADAQERTPQSPNGAPSTDGPGPYETGYYGPPREAAPGEKWVYKTGETNLIGLLVANASGRQMSEYAEQKITGPAGFAGDMFWMTDLEGDNLGGCCLSLRLADYARMGQWVMEGAQPSVPAGWVGEATAEAANVGAPGYGYGYQWWTYPGDAYGAQGIFGQAITIVPDKNIVIAMVSNWPTATGLRDRQRQIFGQMIAAAQ